jgi:uncharacterized protein YbbK (DUF523 family)
MEGPVVRLGISTCLLGEPVRFDGGHQLDRHLTGTLGTFVKWVPVCPEVEMGLPTPRESLRLVGNKDNTRLFAPKSGTNHTEAMIAWARQRIEELAAIGLHGFVFKKTWRNRYPVPDWVHCQVYLQSVPQELMLRNAV